VVAEAPRGPASRFPAHAGVILAIAAFAILAATVGTVAGVVYLREERRAVGSSLVERFLEERVVNRREAWFEVGDLDVAVLEVRVLDDGRVGLRILVIAQEGADADRWTLATTLPSQVEPRPGRTFVPGLVDQGAERTRIADFVVAAPSGIGREFEVRVVDIVTGAEVGAFGVDLDDLRVPQEHLDPSTAAD
jgi:hypothetical protein